MKNLLHLGVSSKIQVWLFAATGLGRGHTKGNGGCLQGSQKKSERLSSPVLEDMLLKDVASEHPCCNTAMELEMEKCCCFYTSVQKILVICPIKPNASKPNFSSVILTGMYL